MIRTGLKQLYEWSKKPNRKPLIVWGARQVGKSYAVKNLFAETYYKDRYIYIDCRIENDICEFCNKNLSAKLITSFISTAKNITIDEKTLLIFDEVQECPAVITALKYFCQDLPKIPVIATGSMVRIKLNRKGRGNASGENYLFPVGKINQMTLYPMTFDEFLINYNKNMFDVICNAYKNKKPLPKEFHQIALDLIYKYLLVGGMPEALNSFIETENFVESRAILKDLYENYLSDMELYQASHESILRSKKIFQSVYSLLNRESKNFKSGIIEKNTRTRDMRSPLDWLTEAFIVHKSFILNEHITQPLLNEKDTMFRLFLCDVGMFAYQSGINPATFISPSAKNTLSGVFFENYVATELAARGLPLYYWRGKNDAEIEFVVESKGLLFPIDVKKGRGTLNSLEKFSNHNNYEVAIKVSKNNFGYDKEKRLLTLPFYMLFLLADDLAKCFEVD